MLQNIVYIQDMCLIPNLSSVNIHCSVKLKERNVDMFFCRFATQLPLSILAKNFALFLPSFQKILKVKFAHIGHQIKEILKACFSHYCGFAT